MARKIIITLDGGAACGKSSVAQQLAQRLHYTYLDTGAMYRGVALFLHELGFNPRSEENKIQVALENIRIDFRVIPPSPTQRLFLQDKDVEDAIRSLAISELASDFATLSVVREKCMEVQKSFAKNKGIVADGRDMGTTVFPEAELKFFLTASPEIRAQRRYKELKKKGISTRFEAVMENLKKRDEQDRSRPLSPLIPAEDALIIDNSTLTMESQVRLMYEKARAMIEK